MNLRTIHDSAHGACPIVAPHMHLVTRAEIVTDFLKTDGLAAETVRQLFMEGRPTARAVLDTLRRLAR